MHSKVKLGDTYRNILGVGTVGTGNQSGTLTLTHYIQVFYTMKQLNGIKPSFILIN